MPKKIFLLPGFLEDERVFAKLTPLLQETHKVIHVPYPAILDELPLEKPDIQFFANRLIEKNEIKSDDLVVGHSFGGWAAANIQQIANCPVVQIGSFTDTGRIVGPALTRFLENYYIRWGGFRWGITHWHINRKFRGKPSQESMQICQNVMKTWPPEQMIKVLRLMKYKKLPKMEAPTLRIHGVKDNIVRRPREWHIALDGDHFIQWTHAQTVSNIIRLWEEKSYFQID